MSDPVSKDTQVVPVEQPTRMVPSWLKVGLIVLGGCSAVVGTLGASGVALPGWLIAACGVVTSVCAAFGVGSEGVKVPK